MARATRVLSQRELNRTLLERQALLERSARTALDMIERLVAVQGQEPDSPYLGLWTRLARFKRGDLTSLLEGRSVVRSTVNRVTQHLVSADDYRWLRPTIHPALVRNGKVAYDARALDGIGPDELAGVARELLGDGVITRRALGRALVERFPGHDRDVLVGAVHLLLPLVHPPPAGTWGHRGTIPCGLAEAWIGRPMEPPSPERLVRRYLAAFGPASVMDVQQWSGLSRLREVMERLRPELRVYRDEHGRELFDVADGTLADPDSPAPVRFLPAFDNLILGHADRTRVISDDDRRLAIEGGDVRAVILVDGFVRGLWSVTGSVLTVTPFRPLSGAESRSIRDEAERLVAFLAPGAPGREVVFA